MKNKWISGLTFEYGAWFCNSDNRAAANGCNQYRIQTNARAGRQTLFDTGANSVGDGLTIQQGPGLVWNVGPYTLRSMYAWQRSEDRGTGIDRHRSEWQRRKESPCLPDRSRSISVEPQGLVDRIVDDDRVDLGRLPL